MVLPGATAVDNAILKDAESASVSRFQRKDALILLALVAIASCLFLPFLGAPGMFDPTDSFFIETAREMLQTGQITVPMFNYEPWLDKPALAFWMIILCYKAFGISEFAGRLPSALSGILLVMSTFVLSRQLLSRRQAFFCAMVLASSPLFLIVGHVALTDEPLALFLTTSLLSIAVFLAKRQTAFLYLGYFALCLAALCKGPLALVLVGLVTVGYLLFTAPKKIVSSILNLKPLLAIALLTILVVPYYVWAHIDTHGAFTNSFFLRQNLGRMVGVVNHVNPAWWYIPVLIGGFFPWSLCALSSSQFLIKYFRNRSKLTTPRQQLIFFCICWALLGFVFFSAIPTKLQTYIVPIFPALAIVMGNYLDILVRLKRTVPLLISSLAMLIVCASTAAIVKLLSDGPGLLTWLGYASAGAITLTLAATLFFVRQSTCKLAGTVYGATMLTCGIFIPLLFCLYHDKYQANVDNVVHYSFDNKANLAAVYFPMPSAIFQYEHKIPLLKDEDELQSYSDEPGPRWILIHQDVLSLLCWTKRSPRVVGHSGKYWLFAIGKNALKEDTIEWNGLGNKFHYPTIAAR